MNKKSALSFSVVIVSLIGMSFLTMKNKIPPPIKEMTVTKQVVIARQKIDVEIADTVTTQEQGLSGRINLKETQGMLFVFNTTGKYPFWMKDMKFPIDIIWIGEDFKVTYIEKNAKPESYPNILGGAVESRYVLEVNAGFSQKNNLKIGDSVQLLP